MPTIECKKAVEASNPKAHSMFGNPKPTPFPFWGQPTPRPQQIHFQFHDNDSSSPDNAPQDVDQSYHLSNSTSTPNSLNETCSLDTSGDHLLHLDSPSLSPELQDASSVESDEVEFFLDFEKPFGQQQFSTNRCSQCTT